MGKIRVTKKEIKESFKNIITVGYCEGWYLLQGIEPDFYTCGIYGWNEDIYKIDYNTIITTGYNPIDGNFRNHELTKKYNEKAQKIYNNHSLDYKTQLKKIEKLRNKYIEEITGGVENDL